MAEISGEMQLSIPALSMAGVSREMQIPITALPVAEMSREMQISIAASSMFPGFRFSPTDEELISYYLKKKLEGSDKCVDVISEVELWKHEPWDLPAKSVIQSENEWFFFSPRGKKYPNGSQSKRATESGYWKATGKERNVKSGSNLIGTKRTLVFHMGRAPKGERTEWIMHEYCMREKDQDSMVVCRLRKNSEFRLNDTPRQGSLSQSHLSTGSQSNVALSDVIEGSGLFEGSKAVECGSSNNSQSVQQIDSGSESDSVQNLTNQSSLPGSSSNLKDPDDEDCFAEILKDDIIKLDEPPDILPMVAINSEAEMKSKQPIQAIMSHVLPFQGTAEPILEMQRRRKQKEYNAKPLEALEARNENHVEEITRPKSNTEQRPKCILSIISERTGNRQFIFISIFLVVLALLVLIASLLGGSWKAKRFTFTF
ncbi:hypothetical protein F0562_022314 [Nyssa sinensis]|uniref:NAC domain-containing protein n=1 Tax=Nyssa sinensis TaxID=561372 RepID=A0A5J5BRB2_9ASTE|nr:hypothetical protein F0562_022314 [Nyssa sinensis]